MAPNRKKNQNGNNHGQQGNGNQQNRPPNNGVGSRPMKCVRPTGCLDPSRLIYIEEIESGDIEVVKVECNNKQCEEGEYMHAECFLEWEEMVLNFLSSTGRARSWSLRQRYQNLWTKKGYDLAFKACDCRCGKGHLQKDVHWVSPAKQNKMRNAAAARANDGADGQQQANGAVAANPQQDGGKKKKKSKALPTLALSAPVPHPNDNHTRKMSVSSNLSSSAGSSNASTSTLVAGSSGSFDSGIGLDSPSTSNPTLASASYRDGPTQGQGSLASYNGDHHDPIRPRIDSMSSECSGSSAPMSGASCSPPSPGPQFGPSVLANAWKLQRKNSCPNGITSDRTRHASTGNIFSRRGDHSCFNVLPRYKVNSYRIKTEDDAHEKGDVGCIKNTILYNLSNNGMNSVNCCLCKGRMTVYDRYPLIDGTFFLSPRQHGKGAISISPIPTPVEPAPNSASPPKFLNAICMHCLEGKTAALFCRWCHKQWDGSDLVLGGCYSYDVFAAMPCCHERRQCASCGTYVQIYADRMFFSDFSQPSRCMRCGLVDFHLAKPAHVFFEQFTTNRVF